MAATFRSVVTELWASLGEPPPSFSDEDAIELDSEGVRLRLEEAGPGLVASADIGPLFADPMRRAEQARRILSDNFDFLLSHRACVHLRSGGDGQTMLMVSGLHSYDDTIGSLADLIDQVLSLRQWHVEALQDGSHPSPGFSRETHEQSDVIFRP